MPDAYYWLPKKEQVNTPGWEGWVIVSNACPNQKIYRRLTRAERLSYEKVARRTTGLAFARGPRG
jgi:hypothetical protein